MDSNIIVTFSRLDTDEIIGQLIERDGVLCFEGDADESAQYFFDWICTTFNRRGEEFRLAKDN